MTTRKQDYEHAYSCGEAAAEGWFDDAAATREEPEAREAAWQDFRSTHGLTGVSAVTPKSDRMHVGFMDGWNDFSDRYDVASGYAEEGYRSEDAS